MDGVGGHGSIMRQGVLPCPLALVGELTCASAAQDIPWDVSTASA